MTSKAIWVLGDLRTERLWEESLKVMTKAIASAEKIEAPVTVVLMGPPDNHRMDKKNIDLTACMTMTAAADQALSAGANIVYDVTHEQLAVPRTDVYANVLEEMVMARQPWLVLVTLNDFGREIAAFCARRCNAGLIADCETLILTENKVIGRCPAWGGQILADITLAQGWPTAFVTMQPHGFEMTQNNRTDGRIENIRLKHVQLPKGLKLKERRMAPVATRRLEDAHSIVVGGAGLTDMRGFGLVRDLAAALGAEVGATRPPVLHHWVEEERLIGQTGKAVHPKLLFTIGTSGAIQYTAGITEADIIVAINRDPSAPIFHNADIGIVADAHTILPMLTQHAKQIALRRLADAACYLSEDVPGEPRSGFGAMIRRLRNAKDWSTAELARKTGQTPEFITHIETDQMSPPVGFIIHMAKIMEVDPGAFLNKEEQEAIRNRRSQAIHQRTQNYSYTPLTPEGESSHLHAFMVTIEPQLTHKPVAYKHEGEEFIFVTTGNLELTLGSATHKLKTGESIHFNSDIPHKLKSISNEPTQCLVVLYTI